MPEDISAADIRHEANKLREVAQQLGEQGSITEQQQVERHADHITACINRIDAFNDTNITGFAEVVEYYADRAASEIDNNHPARSPILAIQNQCAGKIDGSLVPLSNTQERLDRIRTVATEARERLLDIVDSTVRDACLSDFYHILDLCDPDSNPDTDAAE